MPLPGVQSSHCSNLAPEFLWPENLNKKLLSEAEYVVAIIIIHIVIIVVGSGDHVDVVVVELIFFSLFFFFFFFCCELSALKGESGT